MHRRHELDLARCVLNMLNAENQSKTCTKFVSVQRILGRLDPAMQQQTRELGDVLFRTAWTWSVDMLQGQLSVAQLSFDPGVLCSQCSEDLTGAH